VIPGGEKGGVPEAPGERGRQAHDRSPGTHREPRRAHPHRVRGLLDLVDWMTEQNAPPKRRSMLPGGRSRAISVTHLSVRKLAESYKWEK
jgi:hypothetical protein